MGSCKSEHVSALIDCTHLGRSITGIERITEELFSQEALESTSLYYLQSSNTLHLIYQQWIGIVAKALSHANSLVITPGFPPSVLASILLKKRLIPYIHDLFLLTRKEELNQRAKYYMRPSLAFAVKYLNTFIVNSKKTETELREFCKSGAEILLYRPVVKNIFDLEVNPGKYESLDLQRLKIVMLGTLEPRKNYSGALALFQSLQKQLGDSIELHIVGRMGWGDDAEKLKAAAGVHCHGYLSAQDIKSLVESATFYLSSSHDEGLGLPLLELQYSGIAVVANDIAVFQEVLEESGLLIDINAPDSSASAIVEYFSNIDNTSTQVQRSLNNLAHWNQVAELDRVKLKTYLFGE